MHRHRVQASGDAAVAIGGDNVGGVMTSPTFITLSAPPAVRSPRERPRLLPPHAVDFTGREAEIDALRSGANSPRANLSPQVAVITGKPGVGKTALAVHVAYEARSAYERGDLYADLRGAGTHPATPEEIMGRFLRALGVPEPEIPADGHARLDTYRQVLADQPLIMVLDNAADESQVRQLIPPGSSALVLVTSRSRLHGLEGARRTDLDVFPAATSLEFLRAIVGAGPVDADLDSARDVVSSCGHLPLALRIAGIRLATTRHMRIADLAAELRDQLRRLELPEAGDLAVRAAFNVSYRKLGKGTKNAFKRLSLVPAEDFGPGLCAALLDCDERQAGRLLQKLYEVNLIEAAAALGRYRFHDLLKVYSRDKLQADPETSRRAAQSRMLEWLTQSCVLAHFTLIGQADRVELESTRVARMGTMQSALGWANAELSNAVAALPLLLEDAAHAEAAQLALTLCATCEILGDWQHWDKVIRHGLVAAQTIDQPLIEIMLRHAEVNLARERRDFATGLELASRIHTKALSSGEPFAIAATANLLGCLLMDVGTPQEALPLLEQSLALHRELGLSNRVGQVLYNLGAIHRSSGNTLEAIRLFKEDLRVCIETGDESGAAETLNALGLAYREVGLHSQAEELQLQSLAVFEKIGNPHKVSMVCNDLGLTLRHLGRTDEALELHLRDIEISRHCGNVSGEAVAQANAAEALHVLGRSDEARVRFDAALSTFAEIGDELRLARALLGEARLHFDLGAPDRAMVCAERAIPLLTAWGDSRDVVTAYQLMSNHSAETGQYEASLAHARAALEIGHSGSPLLRGTSLSLALVASVKLDLKDEAHTYAEELRSLVAQFPGLQEELSEETGDYWT